MLFHWISGNTFTTVCKATLVAITVAMPGACPVALAQAEPWQWTEREIRVLRSFTIEHLGDPPPSPGNRYANDPAAQALGESLFFDPELSGNGRISCATCHQPDNYFIDGLPKAVGLSDGTRNTPTITGAAWNTWFYWDGRRDSLWAQALIPFEAENEMGSDRLSVVRKVLNNPQHLTLYESVFGPAPDLSDISLDSAGALSSEPARSNWFRLNAVQQQRVNRAFANIGKAIAAWERTQLFPETAFDAYVLSLADTGESHAGAQISESAKRGARLFMNAEKTQCLQCHNGPNFTNGGFHNIGTGNFEGHVLDFGRMFGIQAVLLDEFNCLGPYSDAIAEDCSALRFLNKDAHIPFKGAFKTPTLRGVANTAPFMHDGSFATLLDVMQHYNEPPGSSAVGAHELRALNLVDDEIQALIAFMQALSQPAL